MPPGCLSAVMLLGLLFLIPIFLADAMLLALSKLGLSPGASLLVLVGIFLGGLVNLPLRRIPRDEWLEASPFGVFGVERMWPQWVRRRSYTLVAVNVGGCLVPCGVAVYELLRVAGVGTVPLAAALAAVALNTGVCYWLARPVPGVGIAMPPLVPAVVAALCGLFFVRELAPPVAFCSGVLGPVLGADLLHLRDIGRLQTGVASIGGAGTFDGIVLSGLLATLLA